MKKALLLCAALLLGGCSDSFFYGDSNRIAPKPLPRISNKVQPKVLWKQSVGDASPGYFFRPASDGDHIYAVSVDGVVMALDRASGKVRWKKELNNAISSGIAYGNDRLLIGTKNGDLLALSATDGRTMWRSPLGSYALSPAVVDSDMAVVRSVDGTINAFDLQDGERIWRYKLAHTPQGLRGNQTPYVGNGVVIATSDGGQMVILNQATGLLINEQQGAKQLIKEGSGLGLFDMDANVLISPQGIMFSSVNELQIMAVDLRKGSVAWEKRGLGTNKNFAMNMHRLFVADSKDEIHALEQQDGQERWSSKLLQGRQISSIFAVDDLIATVDREGYLHLFNEATGEPVGQLRLGDAGASASPLIQGNEVYWQLEDGSLVAFRIGS